MGAGPRGELREERRGPQVTGFRPAGREGQVRWVRRPEQHVGFIFVLAFFFFWSSSLGDREILLPPNFKCRDPIIYVFII